MHRISRRDFLLKVAGTLTAVEFTNFLGWIPGMIAPVKASALPNVSVSTGTDGDSAESILRTALEALGGINRFVKPGQTVAIKPNATWAYPPGTASSTDPELLKAMVKLCQEAGARKIIVMDHCSIEPGAVESLRVNGLGKTVKELGVESLFIDRFSGTKDLYTKIDLPEGKAFQKLGVIKAAVDADVRINMAVAKSHSVTRMTMSLKHMMGFLEVPGSLHAFLSQGIADLNTKSAIKADLHILEAIRVRLPLGDYRVCAGPETEKTNPKIVKRMNEIVAGIDPVLIDAYGCIKYYQIQPKELAHLKLAADSGAGDLNVDQATSSGSLVEVKVGEVKPVPTIEQPTLVNKVITTKLPTQAGPPPTATPMPTLSDDQNQNILLPEVVASTNSCVDVINPNSLLSGALIPVAAIIAGAGLITLHNKAKSEKNQEEEIIDDQPGE
jgi:uncharacterized protein (DUF362 family)